MYKIRSLNFPLWRECGADYRHELPPLYSNVEISAERRLSCRSGFNDFGNSLRGVDHIRLEIVANFFFFLNFRCLPTLDIFICLEASVELAITHNLKRPFEFLSEYKG